MVEMLENYPEVERWLVGRTKGTRGTYLSGLRAYIEFRKLSPTEIIDEIEQDRDKSRRKQGTPELWINKFYEWLTTEYVQKRRGVHQKRITKPRKRRTSGKIGVSSGLATTYCMSIRSFYKQNGFDIKGNLLNIPKSVEREANSKLRLRQPDIYKLINVAGCVRDRAIILLQYQSFQGVAEVCKLNFGHVQKALEAGEDFIRVDSVRKKTKVPYQFVIGSEVVELLKIYLNERRELGEELRFDSPLFIQERQRSEIVRLTTGAIESMMVTVALKSGLVTTKQMEVADLNPCRPHALRSSGMTVAKLDGMPEVAVEYMAGHKLDRTTQAYWQDRGDELLNLYKKHYHGLRVLKPAIDEVKVKELETRVLKRDDVIDALIENSKNKDKKIEQLEKRISRFEKDFYRFMEMAERLEKRFDEMDKQRQVVAKVPEGEELADWIQKQLKEKKT
jgi:integrase